MEKLLLILLLTTSLFAGTNKKFSYKDFSDKSLKEYKAEDLNNSDIIGSCFYQQDKVNADIFPDGIKNVTFIDCNLDNVKIPLMCFMKDCCNHQLKVQADKELWRVDSKTLKPIEPHSKAKFVKLGLSILPKDIVESDKPITIKTEEAKKLELETEQKKLDSLSDDEKLIKLKSLNILEVIK